MFGLSTRESTKSVGKMSHDYDSVTKLPPVLEDIKSRMNYETRRFKLTVQRSKMTSAGSERYSLDVH